jgi:hypothetical protein
MNNYSGFIKDDRKYLQLVALATLALFISLLAGCTSGAAGNGTNKEAANAQAPVSSSEQAKLQDSLLSEVKKDTAYKVTQADLKDGVIRIAVSNPDQDVVGHFNIHYDMHISRGSVDGKGFGVYDGDGYLWNCHLYEYAGGSTVI